MKHEEMIKILDKIDADPPEDGAIVICYHKNDELSAKVLGHGDQGDVMICACELVTSIAERSLIKNALNAAIALIVKMGAEDGLIEVKMPDGAKVATFDTSRRKN